MSRRPATYDDLIGAPDGLTAELIDGELVLTPRPGAAHGVTSTRAGAGLIAQFDDGPRGGWVFLDEPELWLGPPDAPDTEVLVPDLAAWRRDRFALPTTHGHTVRPDWIGEVLSPSTVRRDRIDKLRIYAREAVAHVWILDPLAETVEAYALRDGVYALVASAAGDDEARLPPFDAVALAIGRWWVSDLAPREG